MNALNCISRRTILPIGLLLFLATTPLKAQDFSLCSVVDAKHKVVTLGWNRPQEQVNGYSFEYNGHEVTPYRPTIEDVDQLSFREGVGFGKHIFKISGFNTDLTTNEVVVHLKRPHYYTALVPGLFQALHQDRYVTSCESRPRVANRIMGVAEPAVLFAGTGFATVLWLRFFKHKNAALNARDTYLNTLRGEELTLWRLERDKAKDVFPQAMAVSIATLTVNAITTFFLSPRGKASIKGGFALDCNTHPGNVGLCLKL